MPTTPNYALRYPSASDADNVPLDMQELATDLDTLLIQGAKDGAQSFNATGTISDTGGKFVRFTSSTDDQTLTLPVAVVGRSFVVSNEGNDAVTIAPGASGSINGGANIVLPRFDAMLLVCVSANNWRGMILSRGAHRTARSYATGGTLTNGVIESVGGLGGGASVWSSLGYAEASGGAVVNALLDGKYRLHMFATFAANAVGARQIWPDRTRAGVTTDLVTKASVQGAESGAVTTVDLTTIVDCLAGDSFGMKAVQTSGGNLAINGGDGITFAELEYLGA